MPPGTGTKVGDPTPGAAAGTLVLPRDRVITGLRGHSQAVESGTKNRATQEDETCPAAYSDSEELVTGHASYSDSEELIPAATSRDERTRSRERRLSASGGRSSEHSAQVSPRARTVSRTTNEASGRLRPWTRADTDLSKALSQVLRHRSTLRLDDAGFASIKDVLDNPRIRSHRPTSAWLHYIIKANDKRRFALDETGTRVRAVQGHSVPIDSSQLLRQLALGDFGSLVPAHGLHSTYFVHIPSIMQHGLLPGGRKGERFRRHIHLAMSRNPTAGLRSGSEVILEIDLARAHNSGCTFFVSENGVLLTEDVIPPPCIVHATRTDNGAVHELRKFRSAYKRVCTASSPHLPADMCLNSLTSIAATKSLVRSGLRCHKCFLRSRICLCDRAPVEIDRRDPASGTCGQYKFLHQLYVYPPVLLCPTVGEKWHDTCSGSAPWQHPRRKAALGRKAATPLSHLLVGEPVIVAFSASAQRQHMHSPDSLRSLYGPRSYRQCRARCSWFASSGRSETFTCWDCQPALIMSGFAVCDHAWGRWPTHTSHGCPHAPMTFPLRSCMWYSTQRIRRQAWPMPPCLLLLPNSKRPGGSPSI